LQLFLGGLCIAFSFGEGNYAIFGSYAIVAVRFAIAATHWFEQFIAHSIWFYFAWINAISFILGRYASGK
jgi:hypothetical protein